MLIPILASLAALCFAGSAVALGLAVRAWARDTSRVEAEPDALATAITHEPEPEFVTPGDLELSLDDTQESALGPFIDALDDPEESSTEMFRLPPRLR